METEAFVLRIGAVLEEFSSLEGIVEAGRSLEYEFCDLRKDAIIAMTKEAGIQTPPSVGERLGKVR
ncbi:hypothetical protein N7E02_04210 (plasmid) [Aliirhizobium terrae]|uniref:hypothetical protein n=1 Tax=Terrirhizobium terrae TaxID=2926709 RepID=UPI002575BF41|nr:hypothetical protein [Rhizobium sp. CC-CFT758]WJH38608.1 hypothetical protein N7E02_04210 [Rhizobium sp. CC-CFT758]